MPKLEILGRHCIVCNTFWIAGHPHDLNGFCPECHKALCELIKKQKGENDGTVEERRVIEEYQQLKRRYEKLHRMLIKYECGTLGFEPNCSYELLRRQESAMVEYLNVLEIRAEIENIDIYCENDCEAAG